MEKPGSTTAFIPETLGLDTVIFFYIVGMLGTHQPVPDPEIEPVIAPEFAVMKIVVNGSIEYFEEERLSEAAGQDLVTQVAIYIDDKSADREQQDGQGMNRDHKDDDQQHGAFRPCLDEMKGIRGPG
jgi:hypothetical protein